MNSRNLRGAVGEPDSSLGSLGAGEQMRGTAVRLITPSTEMNFRFRASKCAALDALIARADDRFLEARKEAGGGRT